MTLKNKLGIHNAVELSRQEERLSKQRALELFDEGLLDTFEIGTFAGLQAIHAHLFCDVYDFAGDVRTGNIAKGSFRFAPSLYLDAALESISAMPQSTFDEIIEKYVEMNVAHPFWEGNGRSMRIWLDAHASPRAGCRNRLEPGRQRGLSACHGTQSVRDREIKALLNAALTDKAADREVFMKGIDASYRYEGLEEYETGNLPEDDED